MNAAAHQHKRISELVAAAEQVAEHNAGDDPFCDWASAATAIALARMPNTPPPPVGITASTCTALLDEALSLLDGLPAAERLPSHSLDRVYLAAALARAQDLER
jgi:hypothetical protein